MTASQNIQHPPVGEVPSRPGQLYATVSGHLYHAGKICIVMVGLPGRGKTNLSERIKRFLNWLGVRTRTFHLSNYRREILGPHFKLTTEYILNESSPDRLKVKNKCVEDILAFFKEEGGQVAVYDAVNARSKDRLFLQDLFKENGVECLFVESLVTNEHILARNIAEVQVSSPEYVGKNSQDGIERYLKLIETRIAYYEPIREKKLLCIKLVNEGEQCVVNNGPLGYLLNRVLMFLLNSRWRSGSIFFARSGATETNDYSNIGDDDLNSRGIMYADILANTILQYISEKQGNCSNVTMDMAKLRKMADRSQIFASGNPSKTASLRSTISPTLDTSIPTSIRSAFPTMPESMNGSSANSPPPSFVNVSPDSSLQSSQSRKGGAPCSHGEPPLKVWTSTRRRFEQTSRPFKEAGVPVYTKSLLNQLNFGDAGPYIKDFEKLQQKFPAEFEAHMKDRYHHRFPRGESYQDVAIRLEPLIMEMERVQTNLLVIAHESVLRVLYGYIMGLSTEDIPKLEFPANQIVEIVSHGYYDNVVKITLPGVSVDGSVYLSEREASESVNS